MTSDQNLRAQEDAARVIAAGGSVADAAKAAGLSERWVYRLRNRPDFVALVERLGKSVSVSRADPDEKLARRVLREVAKDQDAPAAARVAAARELNAQAAARRKGTPESPVGDLAGAMAEAEQALSAAKKFRALAGGKK